MGNPILNSISSQWGAILDTALFNAIVRPNENTRAIDAVLFNAIVRPDENTGAIDAVMFNAIVRPEENTEASLRKNRMSWLESDMISRDISTRGGEPS
jgi:hypothetical protein